MIEVVLSRKLGELRMSQRELSRRTGIRPNTINALYNDFVWRIDLDQLDAICQACDCEVGDILERVPESEGSTKFKRNPRRKQKPDNEENG